MMWIVCDRFPNGPSKHNETNWNPPEVKREQNANRKNTPQWHCVYFIFTNRVSVRSNNNKNKNIINYSRSARLHGLPFFGTATRIYNRIRIAHRHATHGQQLIDSNRLHMLYFQFRVCSRRFVYSKASQKFRCKRHGGSVDARLCVRTTEPYKENIQCCCFFFLLSSLQFCFLVSTRT